MKIQGNKNHYNFKNIILENDTILAFDYFNIKLIVIRNQQKKKQRKSYPQTVIQIILEI